jgi:ABC-type multidrug transport system fused ATPase/permease subunit
MMQANGLIDALPLWALFICILLVVLLSVECGYRLGRYRRGQQEKEAPVGTMVGATLGLLAFILAFTFGLAAARFDTRRQVLLDEANAIGTTYLRAGMLPDRGEQIRGLLRDYVAVRLDAVRSGNVGEGIRRSETIQQHVWEEAEALGEKNPNSIVVGLFVQSLNEMIDLHAKRVQAGVRSRIPGAIWLGLFAVAVLSLSAMGYLEGLSGTRRSLAIIAVAIAFSVVIELIADLDRPQEGVLRVSQQALLDVQRSMNAPEP